MMPPEPVRTMASVKNCQVTSLRRAPMALRTPISRVRWVTDMSMIFMTPKLIGDLLRTGDAEIVGLVVGNVAAAAQDTSDLVLGQGHLPGISHGADKIVVVHGEMLVVTAIGDHDRFVRGLILDKLAFAELENADNFVGDTLDEYGLADRVAIGIEGLGDVGADDGDIGAMLVFGFAEEAAGLGVGIEDFLGGRESPVVIDAGNFLATVARGDGATGGAVVFKARVNAGGDGANRGTEFTDR